MSTLARLAGFVVGLVAVFAVALGAGSLWGPTVAAPEVHEEDAGHAGDAGHDEGSAEAESEAHLPGGLLRSQDGYTLVLSETVAPSGPLTVKDSGTRR